MQSIDKINQGLPPPVLPPERVATAKTTSMDDCTMVVPLIMTLLHTRPRTLQVVVPTSSSRRLPPSFCLVVEDHRFGSSQNEIVRAASGSLEYFRRALASTKQEATLYLSNQQTLTSRANQCGDSTKCGQCRRGQIQNAVAADRQLEAQHTYTCASTESRHTQ
jgi:hypothetical protein